jgi:hypothetical protein
VVRQFSSVARYFPVAAAALLIHSNQVGESSSWALFYGAVLLVWVSAVTRGTC